MNRFLGHIGKIPVYVLLGVWTLIISIPLLVVILTSLKTMPEVKSNPLSLPSSFQWSNYSVAFEQGKMLAGFSNSLIITSLALVFIVILSSMAAFPLARSQSKWASVIYLYFLSGIMVPFQIAMVPLYKLLNSLGLNNSHLGVILIYTSSAMAFAIFLYTSFYKTVPRELEEAAKIDGCGPIRTFFVILFPLIKPITSTVIITNALFIWNDFFVPLLFLQSQNSRTIPLSIYMFKSQYATDWTLTFAAVIIASLPLVILFFSLQRFFVQGIASGAVKG